MTVFEPTTRTIHPPPEEDALGAAILAALRRELALKLTGPWWAVLVLGLATFGLAPLVVLVLRFRTFATAQKFQLEHVTEWLDANGFGGEDLHRATDRLGRTWRMLVVAGIVFAVAAFATAVAHVWREGLNFTTLGALFSIYLPQGLGPAYGLLLVAAYLGCHWLALHLFARRVRQYLGVLNERLKQQHLDPIPPPPRWIGAGLRWVGIGSILLLCGILWGLPMMLAGGAHRRYINRFSEQLRAGVATRIEALKVEAAKTNA